MGLSASISLQNRVTDGYTFIANVALKQPRRRRDQLLHRVLVFEAKRTAQFAHTLILPLLYLSSLSLTGMKIPLVLLPGLMCDETVWKDQIQAFADVAEPHVAEYGSLNSLPAMATAVLKTAPQNFALAGHSMGGRIAMEMFRQAPERITHLCLMDTRHHPLPSGEAGEKERAGRLRLLAIAKEKGTRIMGEDWVKGMVHPDRLTDTTLINAILEMFTRKSPDIFEAQQTALLNRPDAGMLMPQIRCPTLVLCGREDGWSTPEWHERMAREIPGSKLGIIEQCGHMSTMERPSEVSAALRSWLTPP
jgi:pimeloyl-ACP methyl ester carboxylesterase